MTYKKTILVDFDGVLSSYISGWQGADVANDPPVPGAIEWLRIMIADARVDVQIYSSRSRQDGGILCMKNWLIRHGMSAPEVDGIKFPTEKPAAFVTIDDRAICFKGEFMEPDDIINFQPWYSPWPRWTTYAKDEADKYGIDVVLPATAKKNALWLSSADGFRKEISLPSQEASLHFSVVEPKIRFQVRIAAAEFQRMRDVKAGRAPRGLCSKHGCHHMPNEPLCEWEQKHSNYVVQPIPGR